MNAIMTQSDFERSDPHRPARWEGLAEIDQAIRENRLMEYRLKKSWADPWGRKLTLFVLTVIFGGFAYLAGTSLGFW